MNPETDNYCQVCSISYEGKECPSCNPRHTYYAEVGIPSTPEEYEFIQCNCHDCPANGFWNKMDAINHAKESILSEFSLVRVVDDTGVEVWANR